MWRALRSACFSRYVQRKLQEAPGREYRQAGPSADFRNVVLTRYRRAA
jgi:hypothetical protein